MINRFTGTTEIKIDEKNRLRLPIRYKKALGNPFFVAPGINGCLYIFSKEKFEEMAENLDKISLSDLENQKFVTKFFSNTAEVEADEQCRFCLTAALVKFAKISKEVIVNGSNSRLEIWSKEQWDKMQDINDVDMDNMYKGLSKYGL